ncbi:MAG TPA: hypothetical protein VFA90_17845 [Terriglobales bacterium]|nr:hypothetical protein [Terriglobales bacterium]
MARRSHCKAFVSIFSALLLLATVLFAQNEGHPGRSIGTVSTDGNLIVMELNDSVLGKANLFDLTGRTLRFLPDHSRYRIESAPLRWDDDFGTALSADTVSLRNFSFPFSGTSWNSLRIGVTGWISFVDTEHHDEEGTHTQGISIGRFEPLAEAAGHLFDSAPAICAFFKPRMSGNRYVKELADRVVVTWDITEPFGNIQDFTWFKTTNRFQAVLKRDGEIDLSYKELAARDAIVGVYPNLSSTAKLLTTIHTKEHPDLAAHLDVQKLKLSLLDDAVLEATLETRGPVLQPGDPNLQHFAYRISFRPTSSGSGGSGETVDWMIVGAKPPGRTSTYFVFGPGVSRKVDASGNTITVRGMLPLTLRSNRVSVSAQVITGRNPEKTVEELPKQPVDVSKLKNPEVHFSSLKPSDGPFSFAYESFHYLDLPNPQDLSCTVIKALGDHFDFLAYYSDFRIDNQEAGTPSDGPRGGNVTGIGSRTENLEGYCSQGRFQWGYVQPVFVGANQMQEQPPQGAPVGDTHDITFYEHQLSESTPQRKMLPYNYAMSQLGHEMGHRWGVDVSAKVNGENIVLGPVHWTRALQAPVAFPYQRPTEASAMGGSVWQDNLNGTFTQLDDDYYVPATGYSYLDLYLMGLISPAEVPDFFILKDLVKTGQDANGHPVFKADRTRITVQDVIAAEGPRQPDVDHSQREFNTGMVLVVEHGNSPSKELIDRVNGIRKQWIEYWSIATGHRASMTVSSK